MYTLLILPVCVCVTGLIQDENQDTVVSPRPRALPTPYAHYI